MADMIDLLGASNTLHNGKEVMDLYRSQDWAAKNGEES